METLIENNMPVQVKKAYPYLCTGADILKMQQDKIPYLWEGIINSQGLSALTGSSDVGKSSMLRQLAIAVTLKKTEFLGHKLNVRYGRTIYFSTEDNKVSTNALLKKQIDNNANPADFEGLCYIFNHDNPLDVIEEQLKAEKTDLVIIDAYSDVFMGSGNDLSAVRKFLNSYEKLAQQYDCAIVFLHHTGKRTELLPASKNNIIGSQGFESKMRLVMELRKQDGSSNRQLWFTKGNYLPDAKKNKALELTFNDKQEFEFTGQYIDKNNTITKQKFDDKAKAAMMVEVRKLLQQGITIDKIREQLLLMNFPNPPGIPSKGWLHSWIKEDDNSQSQQTQA